MKTCYSAINRNYVLSLYCSYSKIIQFLFCQKPHIWTVPFEDHAQKKTVFPLRVSCYQPPHDMGGFVEISLTKSHHESMDFPTISLTIYSHMKFPFNLPGKKTCFSQFLQHFPPIHRQKKRHILSTLGTFFRPIPRESDFWSRHHGGPDVFESIW